MKEKIKRFYKLKLWDEPMVRDAVVKGIITAKDYKEITGEAYK